MKRVVIFCIFFFLCFTGFSQLHFDKVNLANERLFTPIALNHFSTPTFPFTTDQPQYRIRYELPKGAIFCRMEDALHKHFNIWIKFRMGNDDRYSD